MFYKARLSSKLNYQEKMKTETSFVGQEINLDNLKAYLDKKYPNLQKARVADISELLKELHKCGYSTLDKLDNDINRTKKAFEKYEEKHPPSNAKSYVPIGIVRGSLAIINKEFREMKYSGSESTYRNYEKYITM